MTFKTIGESLVADNAERKLSALEAITQLADLTTLDPQAFVRQICACLGHNDERITKAAQGGHPRVIGRAI